MSNSMPQEEPKLVSEQIYTSEAEFITAPFAADITQRLSNPGDNHGEVLQLERRSRVLKLLRSYFTPVSSNPGKYVLEAIGSNLPRPRHIGSQFGQLVVTSFIDVDARQARERFRSIEPTTEDQAVLLATSDADLVMVHSAVNAYLQRKAEEINSVVADRFAADSKNGHENRAAFANNDRYEFAGRQTARSLDRLRANGLSVGVEPDGLPILRSAAETTADGARPVIELSKNWPILTINGFKGSKLSLAVHDAVDHMWTFDLADRTGLLSKFSVLFESIGNPQLTDIFKREGEMISSIAFGSRYWEHQDGFRPILDVGYIADLMHEHSRTGRLSERHMRGLAIIEGLKANSTNPEHNSLSFIFSNYLVTLHEQRRRYGQIKQRDTATGLILGELNPLSPDHLCFMIELHHEMAERSEEHAANLFATHGILEEFLMGIGSGRLQADTQLNIRLAEIKDLDISNLQLPEARLAWLFDNYKFSTIKEEVF